MPRSTPLFAFAAITLILLVYTLLPSHPVSSGISATKPEWVPSRYDGIVKSSSTVNHLPTPSNEHTTHHTGSNHKSQQYSEYERTISGLIREADQTFNGLLGNQSKTLHQAADAYRKRRGRHPPPGFDLWFEYAQKHDAVVVEEFWDQIYHDLEPFWAIPPALLRAQARDLGMAVIIKEGHAEVHTDWFWHVIWSKMIGEVAFMLPDMVIPLNSMDEPRLMVPWSMITEYVTSAQAQKSMTIPEHTRKTVQGWGESADNTLPATTVEWSSSAPYSFAREACAPDSPIRQDYKVLASGSIPFHPEAGMEPSQGFVVQNSTLASDTCQDPAIAAYHGALISPLTGSTSQTLLPLFGGSKFAVNNDILIPAPMYWNGEERFEQEDKTPWSEKQNSVVWRGTATGGRHNAFNWPQFHRHRFVALANGTKYSHATSHDRIFTPAQKEVSMQSLPSSIREKLHLWLNHRNNIGFTDLFCDIPVGDSNWGHCWYTDEEFMLSPSLSLNDQYKNKFLPDIDGNSFSGRYRSFLHSGSLPIKATLYREWHDSRLIAWKHFVPMNNRFTDYYTLLSYFSGCEEEICGANGVVKAHDAEAQAIAEAGSAWAKKVLRKVDMQIYVARLLLEFGRITDDERNSVGWVQDLLEESSQQGQL